MEFLFLTNLHNLIFKNRLFNQPKLELMKKTNFTTIQPSWCLGSNWLKGLIPLLALFVLALPMQSHAQQQPNCAQFSPAINQDGEVEVGADDFVSNPDGVGYPITVQILNQWGGPAFASIILGDADTSVFLDVCKYIDT